MQLIYLSTSEIPSSSANSVHVMKMCEAFKQIGIDVKLICPVLSPESDVFKRYNIQNYFSINAPFTKNQRFKIFKYLAFVHKEVKANKQSHFYGRFLLGAAIAGLYKRKNILELHAPPFQISPVSHFVFKLLLRFRCLNSIVVISD